MTIDEPSDEARVAAAPKVLLHDHLDGGLRPVTVIELADAIGWTLPASDPASLQQWFTRGADTRDILQYLATFEHTVAVMQTAAAIERVAAEAVVDLATDGVVYAEVRYAPELHQANGLSLDAVTEAVTSGYRRGEAEARAAGREITVNAICCAMRTGSRSLEIARFVDARRQVDDKVVAFDLAGAETGWPPSLHAEALAFARQRHLNITIHASEPPDLELISDAIAHGAHRIGHGVRLGSDTSIGDDGELLLGPLARHVLDHRIHLEMAPTCNVQIGAVPAVGTHPIGAFLRAGFNVGVNTDNRLMSGVTPSSELLAVARAFELTWTEVGALVTNAAASAFAPFEQRARLIDTIKAVFDSVAGAGAGVVAGASSPTIWAC
ncbi:MAG: adenosine deaminase [Ilumatobacteraceae bacterium]